MPPEMSAGDLSFNIRSFRHADQATCGRLYAEGLVGGSLSENDTCADLDDIQSAYMKCPGSHFWVAEVTHGISNGGGGNGGAANGGAPGGRDVVGMIGVQHHE